VAVDERDCRCPVEARWTSDGGEVNGCFAG
jgi:hypothetical protein